MQVSSSRNNLRFSFCADIPWPKLCFHSQLGKLEATPKHHSIMYDITALYVSERHAASASPRPLWSTTKLLSHAQYLSEPRFTPVSYALATRIMEGRSPASAALSK